MAKRRVSYKEKKKCFRGNRFSTKPVDDNCTSSPTTSASRRKLQDYTFSAKCTSGNMIFNLDIMFNELTRCLRCVCGGQIDMNISVIGLGCKVAIHCKTCAEIGSFRNSAMIGDKKRVFAINRQIVYAMRLLGQGLAGIRLFCGVMDFPPAMKERTYNMIVDKIVECTTSVAEESTSHAAIEEMALQKSDEIAVSCDGSWLTRGHTSQHGVTAVIGVKSGKVLDSEVLSLNCKSCQFWKNKKDTIEYAEWMEEHESVCSRNHAGTSGGMEVEGMKVIFKRSELKHGVKYTKFIGDGDTKTFKSVADMQPYGSETPVMKYECVGHIQKRMGTRLRKLKADMKGKKLADGKGIAGRNRLTDSVITTLTSYYGNAIRANCSSVEKMKQAVWAVWFHKCSTDEKPMHHLCPNEADTWCPYQKAVQENLEKEYKHKKNIPIAIMEAIKPVFQDMCNTELLKKCVGGMTQNANESFHSKIWKICPKTGFYGQRIVKIGTNDAVMTFNDGMLGRLKVMERLGIHVGSNTVTTMKSEDVMRITSAEKRAQHSTKEERKRRKRLKMENEALKEAEEGISYAPGQF